MAGDRVGSATRRSALQRTGAAAAESPPRRRADDGAHHPLFLSEPEVQAVADTNPVALRTLLLPDYDGVATSFAGLLHRVVQRCKRDEQVDGRVLHACEALGVCEGRYVPTIVLAKRLRGFGLAWHSFTLEECEAFVEVELDADEDGRVTVQNIFAFLNTWRLQAQQARRAASARSSRPSALLGGTIAETRRRREARRRSGLFVTRQFPRGLREKLLAAARQARSRGVNVLSMLRVASPGLLERHRDKNGPPPLGARAACHFLRRIGVDCDSLATERTSGGSAYPTHRKRGQGLDATVEPGHSRDDRGSLLQSRQRFPQQRSMYVRPSRQHGWGGCAHERNSRIAGTASCGESWWDGWEKSPVAQPQTSLDASTTSNREDATARSKWVAHGAGGSGYLHDGVNSGSEGVKDANDVGVDEGHRSSAREGEGTCMSQRLHRAAEDLKRMQAEYEELQAQAHEGQGERPSATPGTPAHPTGCRTSEAAERCSYHTARSSLHHHPGSFRPGHSNPEPDYTGCFEGQLKPAPGFQWGGRERRENWGVGYERIQHSSTILRSSSEEETQCSVDATRPRQHAHTRSASTKVNPTSARASDSLAADWPRHGADTRRCRALLLMAAQGKCSREETFDVATARNGFSGIQLSDLGDEAKVCRTRKPRGRRRRANTSNELWRRRVEIKETQGGAVSRGNGAGATTSNGIFPRCSALAVHPFLVSASTGAGRRNAAGGYGVLAGVANEDESASRDRRDFTPERRPTRPKAIKSPMYARRGRSEERNVRDRRSECWARPKPNPGGCVRARSVDHLAALGRHRMRSGCGIVRC